MEITNSKILNSLNNKTKNYIDDTFSYLDCLKQNNKMPNDILLARSFLLSTVKNDNDLNEVFKKYNITEDKISNLFNISIDKVKFTNAEDTNYLKNNDLFNLFTKMISHIKTNNNIADIDQELTVLQPYQIFSYLLEQHYDYYKNLFNRLGIDTNSLLIDLSKKIHELDIKKNIEELDLDTVIYTIDSDSVKDINDTVKLSDLEPKTNKRYRRSTPNLDSIGIDLTEYTYTRKPCVGMDDKIDELGILLSYPNKDKSVIITGPTGCGKKTLIEGFIHKIQTDENINENLKNLRIVKISASDLVSDTQYVGTLEKKILGIIEEIRDDKNIVLFIDCIDQTIGAGLTKGNDNSVAELFKPYLYKGHIRIIGTCTNQNYEKANERNTDFINKFDQIKLKEPSFEVIYQILDNSIDELNDNSECPSLIVEEEQKDMIIKWLIKSTERKIQNRDYTNPTVSLNIINRAYGIARYSGRDEVTSDDFKRSIMMEETLYPSIREDAIKRLNEMSPKKHQCLIINFNSYI